jgi:hypothetical protein
LCAHALPTSRSSTRTPRRQARDLVKIDVNKTSRVWDFLVQAGFLKITPDPPHAAPQDTSYVYIVPLDLDTDELPKYERHLPYSVERISIQGGVAPPTTFFRGRDSSCQSKWIWSQTNTQLHTPFYICTVISFELMYLPAISIPLFSLHQVTCVYASSTSIHFNLCSYLD